MQVITSTSFYKGKVGMGVRVGGCKASIKEVVFPLEKGERAF
jgi:hypothetical protein